MTVAATLLTVPQAAQGGGTPDMYAKLLSELLISYSIIEIVTCSCQEASQTS